MDEFKDALKENKRWIIIGSILIIIGISIFIYNAIKSDGITEKDGTTISTDEYKLTNYEVNEYRVISMSDIDVLNAYLKDYLTKMLNNHEESWDLLSDETKNNFNNNIEEYEDYIDSITTIYTYSNEIVEYRINDDYNYAYDIIDSEGNKYTIIENAVWDFKITLDGKN